MKNVMLIQDRKHIGQLKNGIPISFPSDMNEFLKTWLVEIKERTAIYDKYNILENEKLIMKEKKI